MRPIRIESALKAQQALRDAAGLKPEEFSVESFVGMVSDEIEALRGQGMTDAAIAALIESSAAIRVSAEEIGTFYAPPEQRRG